MLVANTSAEGHMEISQELKDRILAEVERHKSILIARLPIESERAYVKFPIFIDGVVDFIRHNMAEKRFDQVEIQVAKDGIMQAEWLSDWAVYCDDTETVIIQLPSDWANVKAPQS